MAAGASFSLLRQRSFQQCILIIFFVQLVPAFFSAWHLRSYFSTKNCLLLLLPSNEKLWIQQPPIRWPLSTSSRLDVTMTRYHHTVVPNSIAEWALMTSDLWSKQNARIPDGSWSWSWSWTGKNWEKLDQNKEEEEIYSGSIALSFSSSEGIAPQYRGLFQSFRKTGGRSRRPSPFPIATAIFIAINVFLYWYYWNYRISSSVVSLSDTVLRHDLGRGVSGHLAHFEIWHVGFNMMSCQTLGTELEGLYGSLALLLYTISFLPLTTIVVAAIYRIMNRLSTNNTTTSSSTENSTQRQSPHMVGFSGILFCWSVVAMLQQTKTCPVFFLPNLCFNTYHWTILGHPFSLNMGPLVLLVALQFLLPRVSFVGHLAGIVVGFLWHWNVLPSIIWMQPAITFPLSWILGKYLMWEHVALDDHQHSTGNALGGSHSRPRSLSGLFWIRNCWLTLLVVETICGFSKGTQILSQGLLLAILTAFYTKLRQGQYHVSGILGRGYAVLVVVFLVTHGMTLGAWFVTRILWRSAPWFLMLWGLESAYLWLSLGLVCHVLHTSKEGSTQGTFAAAWALLVPCQAIGAGVCRISPCCDSASIRLLDQGNHTLEVVREARVKRSEEMTALV